MTTDIIMAVQTVIFIYGLNSLAHMKKQEAMQSYIVLSDRLFKQNLEELHDDELFVSLGWDGDEYSGKEEKLKRKIKHYLFMQFTMYEQMFCLHEFCKDYNQAMQPWNKRFFSLIKRKKLIEWYWRNDYSKQSCNRFKEFVELCIKSESDKEVDDFFNKRKQTSIAQYFTKYCPFSSICNG